MSEEKLVVEKAYENDIIEINKDLENYKAGQTVTVFMRYADMYDNPKVDQVLLSNGTFINDTDYKIVKKVNPLHYADQVSKVLQVGQSSDILNFLQEKPEESASFFEAVQYLLKEFTD